MTLTFRAQIGQPRDKDVLEELRDYCEQRGIGLLVLLRQHQAQFTLEGTDEQLIELRRFLTTRFEQLVASDQ